jgi:hypothetical protein
MQNARDEYNARAPGTPARLRSGAGAGHFPFSATRLWGPYNLVYTRV